MAVLVHVCIYVHVYAQVYWYIRKMARVGYLNKRNYTSFGLSRMKRVDPWVAGFLFRTAVSTVESYRPRLISGVFSRRIIFLILLFTCFIYLVKYMRWKPPVNAFK